MVTGDKQKEVTTWLEAFAEKMLESHKQIDIAKAIGYAPASVNYHLRNPTKMSPKFIHACSTHLPDFQGAFSEFTRLKTPDAIPDITAGDLATFYNLLEAMEEAQANCLEQVHKMKAFIEVMSGSKTETEPTT